jgi:hypothetical protein
MKIMLLLTAEQAALVRGPSANDPAAVLEPVALPDGRFAVPATVLDDPAHESFHEMLGSLPWASFTPLALSIPFVSLRSLRRRVCQAISFASA